MKLSRLWRFPSRHDYTPEAEALFRRFAERHRLSHRVVDAPVEIMWEFPRQDGLSIPIVLGLQNKDELNFGVPGFWSYFFPFPSAAPVFGAILDAWVNGNARIVHGGYLKGRRLQVLKDGNWDTVYATHTWGKWEHSAKIVQNARPL
jgi:hypothetical protein